jgi:hypothetical protein
MAGLGALAIARLPSERRKEELAAADLARLAEETKN